MRTEAGEVYTARIVVSAMGGLSRPSYPKIRGLKRFRGRVFHSAEWDHAAELNGKRARVIGTGASSIQIVPSIAPAVARLHVFQRTPPWIVPKLVRPIRAGERFLFRWLPGYMRFFRSLLYLRQEMRGLDYAAKPKIYQGHHPMAGTLQPILERDAAPLPAENVLGTVSEQDVSTPLGI